MMKSTLLIVSFFLALFVNSSLTLGQQSNGPTARAGQLLNSGDIKGAIAILDKAIIRKTDLLEVYKMRSFLRSMSGNLTGSVDDLTSAIELKSDEGDLYENRAMARMRIRQDQLLILKDFDSAIQFGRKLDRVYGLRASIHRNMGENAAALLDYQSAIDIRPENPGAHVGMASIYLQAGNDEKAVEILENFLTVYGSSSDGKRKIKSRAVIGTIVPLPSDPKVGIQHMETVIVESGESRSTAPSREDIGKFEQEMEDSKNIALAYTTLASAYANKNEYEKALITVEKAIKKDNSDFYALEVRGRIKVGLGDFQNAINDLNVSIRSFPGNPQVYLDRGIAYLMLGKESEAQQDFGKYLQLYPNGKQTLGKRIEEAKAKWSR